MIFECADRTFGSISAVRVWGGKLEFNVVFAEGFFAWCGSTCCQGCGDWGLRHAGVDVRGMSSRL